MYIENRIFLRVSMMGRWFSEFTRVRTCTICMYASISVIIMLTARALLISRRLLCLLPRLRGSVCSQSGLRTGLWNIRSGSAVFFLRLKGRLPALQWILLCTNS